VRVRRVLGGRARPHGARAGRRRAVAGPHRPRGAGGGVTRVVVRTVTVLALAALALGAVRAGGDETRVVRYADDALTVRLTNAPVVEVLEELSHQSGAEIQGQVTDTSSISADFHKVPLAEALHRLLGTQNFALVYGDRGNLKAVKLLGEAQAP